MDELPQKQFRFIQNRQRPSLVVDPWWVEVVAGMNLKPKLVHTPVSYERHRWAEDLDLGPVKYSSSRRVSFDLGSVFCIFVSSCVVDDLLLALANAHIKSYC
jgi:hypothetical protein